MNLNVYEQFVKDFSHFPPDQGLVYSALAFAGESGEVANEVKKLIRDDGNELTWNRREKILDELGDCIWYMTSLARLCESSLDEIMERNMEKLRKRREERLHAQSGV